MSGAAGWTLTDGSWQCPDCGKRFVRRGLSHSCGIVPLDHHFTNRPRAAQLFDALAAAVSEAGGPFRLSIARTRIGFIAGITFVAVMPRRSYLRFHFLLERRVDSPRVVRLDHYEPWYVHTLELRDEAELDAELRAWLGESWRLSLRQPVATPADHGSPAAGPRED